MVAENLMEKIAKMLISLTFLTGVTAQAQIMEVDKLFNLRGIDDVKDPHRLARISVNSAHTFEKDPWLEVAKQIVKIDDFDDENSEGADSRTLSALGAGKSWEDGIISPILTSKLQKPIRRIHKMTSMLLFQSSQALFPWNSVRRTMSGCGALSSHRHWARRR